MQFNSGSPEPPRECPPEVPPLDPPMGLRFRLQRTDDEIDRIADGEPYCFRCGKPASSFPEYVQGALEECLATSVDYVRHEEGTYNPNTNRFACDACYIAIGMPASPGGWQAP